MNKVTPTVHFWGKPANLSSETNLYCHEVAVVVIFGRGGIKYHVIDGLYQLQLNHGLDYHVLEEHLYCTTVYRSKDEKHGVKLFVCRTCKFVNK